MSDDRFTVLIDKIYEAAVAPEGWPVVLDEVARITDSVGGAMLAVGKTGTRLTASPALAPFAARWQAEGWDERNPRPGRAFAFNRAGFVHDLDLFTPEEMDADPMYRFMRENGLGWCTGTVVRVPTEDILAFSWERRFDRGAFDEAFVRSLDPLRPHLARSGFLAARLGLERVRGAADALEILGLPTIVLSPGGGPMALNAGMADLSGSVWCEGGRVTLVEPGADAILARHLSVPRDYWLHQAVSIPIARTIKAPAMIAHLIPLRGAAHDVFTGAVFLLVMTPLTGPKVAAAELLEGLFDLTAAEAQVARQISLGRSVGDVATLHGVAESTIRTQLKAIFAKTGASRQTELMALLAAPSLPSSRA